MLNFKKYCTYDDFKDSYYFNEEIDEDTFYKLLWKAQMKLDYFTDNRLKKMEVIPEEVKFTLCEYVTILNENNDTSNFNLSSYSNDIESFSFSVDSNNPDKALDSYLYEKAKQNLSSMPMLLYRSR